ncbi:15472_t:CDS:2 [Entrophospora sp. SA101]|nr:15472_t:CDS:2 [Entrophospora sp. SA101]
MSSPKVTNTFVSSITDVTNDAIYGASDEKSNEAKEETDEAKEENDGDESKQAWQMVWNNDVQAYYYWNTLTNETTWTTPTELLQQQEHHQSLEPDNNITSDNQYYGYSEQDYYQYYYGYYPEGYYYEYDPNINTFVRTNNTNINNINNNMLLILILFIIITTTTTTDANNNNVNLTSSVNSSTANTDQTNPLDSLLDKIDTEVNNNQYSKELDGNSEYYSFLAQHGSNNDNNSSEPAGYTVTGRFNSRTGKFQRDPTLNPEKFSAEAKAARQMSYFFDYERYTEQRGLNYAVAAYNNKDRERKRKNDEIENQLKRDRLSMRNEVKMLLLGAGESGKSTILKQMKLIHDGGYSSEERESFKEIIFSNTVQSMRVILEAMGTMGISLRDGSNKGYESIILNLPSQIEGDHLPSDVSTAIKNLWTDSGVRECFNRSREYQLNDSAKYYFDSIDRISQPDYLPDDQDVLRSRVKTTGITETSFLINELTYRMFDVGGQRSERKKWIHCFENVTAIVFLVAISEYDQLLLEDETVNRMQEALTLFDSICNSRWFVKTSIILFLNKIDRFKEKLPLSPMVKYFPDYEGGSDYELACDYILNRFVSLNQSDIKQIYTHFTCATDTEQIKFVMAAVNDIIIQTNLRDCDDDGDGLLDSF